MAWVPKSHSISSVFPNKKAGDGLGKNGRVWWRVGKPAICLSVFPKKKQNLLGGGAGAKVAFYFVCFSEQKRGNWDWMAWERGVAGGNPATRLSVFSNKKEGDGIESERVVGADLATSLSVCSNKKEELGEWWRGGAEVAFFFSPFPDKKEGAGLAVAWGGQSCILLRLLFYGIHNHRTMDGGENPQANTEPKERNFWFSHFLVRQDFSRKIGPDREKVEKISPTHPRRFALHCGPPYFGLGAGNRGAIRGFSSFSEPQRETQIEISGIFGKFRASRKFEFLISFWDFSIRDRKISQPRTTKGFKSVRVETRITTNER